MGRVLTSEDLRNWFSKSHPEGGWKRINSKGEAIGPCAREPGEPKPKCMSNEKRAMLSKSERASAVRTKRKHDPNPERKGEPIMVSNFGKGKITEENEPTNKELWSKIQSLVSGKVASIEYNGKTIEGPNNGKGFRVHPSAYSNGWASAKYKELGGDWKTVKEGRYNFNGFVDREQILSEMKTFGEVIGRTAAVVVEKYIVQDNLKSGVGADELRSYAKKFGAKTKSQKETTEFMFDDENAADSFMKAITGKSLAEANECEGRQAGKPWRTPGEKKKFAVCVDNKIVRFGDPGLSIKRDQPGRLKNFRARHGCDKGGISRDTPKYWSCQMWRKDKSVTDLTQGE
jgi:hypothetical protein